jgi:parallel beta-helix repeat protein
MLAFFTGPIEADDKTIYVDAANESGPWDGTMAHPYKNITVALQYTLARSTIYVSNGTYNERIVINETISLIGENKKITIIDGDGIGTVVEIRADNVFLSGFTINNSGCEWPDSGLRLMNVRNCTISGNNIINNLDGIRLFNFSSNNRIFDNVIEENLGGVSLYYSSNNSICENNITANNGFGIFVHHSLNNNICKNSIINNRWGIGLDFSSEYNYVFENSIQLNHVDGIKFEHSISNIVFKNDIVANSECNVRILGTSKYNCIFENNISYSSYGLVLAGSSFNNSIFHNNFVGNQQQASTDGSNNHWDNGYPSGGNYWSDYREKYPKASEINNSGIWDMPYIIDSNNIDRYPLMNKYGASGDTILEIWIKHVIALLVLFLLICTAYYIIRRKRNRKKKLQANLCLRKS